MPSPGMRVLTVIDSLDASGGAERSLAAMAPNLVGAGVDLHVGYLRARPITVAAELADAGATVHPLDGGGGRLGAARRVAHLTRAVRPDLVHTTLFEADQAGRIGAISARRPVVSSLVNIAYGAEETPPGVTLWKLRAAQLTDASTARLARRFHAITAHVADVMAQRLRIGRDRIDVVYRGRDPERLGRRTPERRARVRNELGIAPDAPVVLAVGRQEWQKGHDTLIASSEELGRRWPGLTVLIAGREGNQTERLRDAARRAGVGDRVRLLGFRNDIADLLSAADVFAFPSRWEGLGSALLEAMALEIPIVASDLPAVREVLRSRDALFVPPSDSAFLSAAVADCLLDVAATHRRVESARRRFIDEFTVEASARAMVAFYERALGSGAAA